MLFQQNHKEYWIINFIQNFRNWGGLVASGMKTDIIFLSALILFVCFNFIVYII